MRGILRATAAALLSAALLTAVAVAPAQATATSKTVASDGVTVKRQHVSVNWSGAKARQQSATAVVPGVGTIRIVCTTKSTMIELQPVNRSSETQMWMAKYQTKDGQDTVAVKTVRIYRYANRDDPGKGGTGARGHEGFNRSSPIEDASSGHMDGVISQRPGRNANAATAALDPVTSFQLSWYWTGFRHAASQQSCSVDLRMQTDLAPRMGLDWHGDDDAARQSARSKAIPGLGTIALRCDPDPDGDQTVTLSRPASSSAWLYAMTISGEGDVDDHTDITQIGTDPVTHQLGPIDLPQNGMLLLYFTIGHRTFDYIVSSYYVDNNALHPELNLCEVAIASF